MDKLRKTIIRCTGFLCASVLFANGFIVMPIASLIIGFIAAYLVGSDAVEDVISTIKETGDK